MFALTLLAAVELVAVEEGPAPEDVKAGWVALIIFLLLALSVAVLGLSLLKRLRNAEAAKEAGLYGDAPAGSADGADGTDQPATGDSPRSV